MTWDKVIAATEGHNIDTVDVHMDEGRSWTYIRCTCGNEPDREAFTEPWEFTDHIRRLVFAAVTEGTPRADAACCYGPQGHHARESHGEGPQVTLPPTDTGGTP